MRIVKLLVMVAAILGMMSVQGFAMVWEDFSDTAGWATSAAGGASGSITTDGTTATFNYTYGDPVTNDWVNNYYEMGGSPGGPQDWSAYDKIILKGLNVPVQDLGDIRSDYNDHSQPLA